MIEPTAKFEEIKIPLRDPAHGVEEVSAVLGIPEWWPTGSRVAIALAHGSTGSLADPLIEYLHRELTERKFMTLRFNFPFAEAGKRKPRPTRARCSKSAYKLRSAIGMLARDPTAAPAHLFLVGRGLGARSGRRAVDLPASLRLDGLVLPRLPAARRQDKTDEGGARRSSTG